MTSKHLEPSAHFNVLAESRTQTDGLFSLLDPEALYERPIPERHRIIFYLGHLEAFDWNLIGRTGLGLESFHPQYDHLFAFGIDPPEGQLPNDQPPDWPSIEEVLDYNRQVRHKLDEAWDSASPELRHVAIEHRWMHAETLVYIFHNLEYSRKKQGPSREPAASPILENSLIDIPAGFATLGRKKEEGFGWDNEFEEHKVHVPAFRIRRHKVANGEYLQFVNAGGEAPFYWTRRGGEWHYRGMFDEIPLPHEWPVYVTFQQAVEYSRWKGVSLPTEAQWHRAAFGTAAGEERLYPWGEAPPDASRGNFDFDRWDPVPVDANPCGESAFGVQQAVGNGWEWTSTVFGPFPGFSPRSYYPGYSANFFDGQHYVLKGGSPRTAAALLRRSFRNWFRPRYPYIYATFRCVEE